MHPHAAQRRDHAAAHGLGQREVGDLGREHVADVLLEQLVGGGHADVHRLREAPDRGRRLLAERGVGLVADDHAVHVGLQLVGVLDEPGVGVDRERRRARGGVADQHRLVEAGAVALLGQVARELVDQQPAVGEDQHAGGAGGVDEAGGGDRLAGGGGVFEPVAAAGAGVVLAGRGLLDLVHGPPRAPPRRRSPGHRRPRPPRHCRCRCHCRCHRRRRRPRPRRRRLAALEVGDQGGQLAGQRVHLVAAQRRPEASLRLLVARAPGRARASASSRAARRSSARSGRDPSRPARRRARPGARCRVRAPRRRPRLHAEAAPRTTPIRGARPLPDRP